MMDSNQDRVKLFIAVISRTATDCQQEKLNQWLRENPKNRELFDKFFNEAFIAEQLDVYDRFDPVTDLQIVKNKMRHNSNRIKINRAMKYVASVAAAVILVSLVLYYVKQDEMSVNNSLISVKKSEITQPILISDSNITTLTNEIEEISVNNQVVVKNKNSQISYSKSADSVKAIESRIIVPKKCQYYVKLEDGTMVTLNANSEMIFPSKFSKNNRTVILKGEAFFEVAKDNRPFVVKVNRASISVYGTKFNVKNTADHTIYTTLVSGSVGVRFPDEVEVMLKPGEMAILKEENENIKVQSVNTYLSTAWTENCFYYENGNLETLLSDLASWYGVSFKYGDAKLININITATYDRNLDLESILKSINKITNIKFIKNTSGEYEIEN